MKFSSIPLITIGLAAIVGSIAAPLHVRELVVDDSLFKRQPNPPDPDWREQHRTVAAALRESARANRCAAARAKRVAKGLQDPPSEKRDWWLQQAVIHAKISQFHDEKANEHTNAAKRKEMSPLHADTINGDLERARQGEIAAEEILAKTDPIKTGSL